MNTERVAAALRALADAIETPAAPQDLPQPPPPQPVEAAKPRGRGRPPKGEGAAPAQPAPAPADADPFGDAPATAAAPVATQADVRKALTDLKAVTTQENALAVMKTAGGVHVITELKPEKYDAVVAAAKAAMPGAPVPEADDPFATGEAVPPAAEPVPTLEDIKAAVVKASKRTAADKAAAIVIKHGGVKAKADGSGNGPSWAALPVSKYAAVLAELNALPTTK